METVFPTADGLAAFFLTSYRVAGGAIQRTGTVILKRTYDVNAATGALSPSASALPIFDSDQMTAFDEEMIQYEYDLAAFKPEGDLVV